MSLYSDCYIYIYGSKAACVVDTLRAYIYTEREHAMDDTSIKHKIDRKMLAICA